MVHYKTLIAVFQQVPETKKYFMIGYTVYAAIAVVITALVIISVENAGRDDECDEWCETDLLMCHWT